VEIELLVDGDRGGHRASLARVYSARIVRICSLLPSATEIVGRLGLADRLVGVSAECNWPPAVRRLPVVTSSRVDSASLTSGQIDAAVREAVADGAALYAIDADVLDELRPDVIVTQDLCRVCAVSSGDVATLCPTSARVVSLDPRTLEEIADSVELLGRELGVPERADTVAGDFRATIAAVERQTASLPRKRVFVAEWLDPPFAAGHWVPEMVAAAGGEEVLGRAGRPSFATTWPEVGEVRPELVVVAPCGFDLARATREAAKLDLPAEYVAVDADRYYSRPAPSVAEGVRQLAFLLHSGECSDPGIAYRARSRRTVVTAPAAASTTP
jgi:iron complex transport system substrate-binding protein